MDDQRDADWDDRGLRRRSFPAGLLLLLAGTLFSVVAVAGVYLVSLLVREAREQRRPFVSALWQRLRDSAAGLLDARFLVDREVRCRLSGRIYPYSSVLAGFVFRYFNLLLMACLMVAFASLVWAGRGLTGLFS